MTGMPFRFRDDIAGADAAFDAWGEMPEELFSSAADALLAVMIENFASVRPVEHRTVSLHADSLEMLLFRFLDELVYLKDAANLFLRAGALEINESGGGWMLRGNLAGEPVDPVRQETAVDVKAVTPYRFRVKKTDSGWRATVVVDV
jgi:SHS2 domain-containing protein